jgi:hypothetical protein
VSPEETTANRIRGALRLLGDEHITGVGRMQIESVLRDIEERTEGPSEHPITPGYPTLDEWRQRFDALGSTVHHAIYDQALLACPSCAMRGVHISWAVVAVEAALSERTR